MTSFQDARDEYFQDVERNKVCSTSLISISIQKISITSARPCNLDQSKPHHMTMKRSNRIFAGPQSKQSSGPSSIPRRTKCYHHLVSSGNDSNPHIRSWMWEEEMNLMRPIWSIPTSKLIVLELQQHIYLLDAPQSYWMDTDARPATLPIFYKPCNSEILREVFHPDWLQIMLRCTVVRPLPSTWMICMYHYGSVKQNISIKTTWRGAGKWWRDIQIESSIDQEHRQRCGFMRCY